MKKDEIGEILVGQLEGNGPLGRLGDICKDIEMDL
jgi:hypothetical protein